jgi:hypothetical protein
MASVNPWFVGAAAAALATCLAHLIVGGRLFAAPLLASGLSPAVKHTNYYCWHLVTAALGSMAGAFLWAGLAPSAWPAGLVAAALAISFMLVNIAQNLVQRLPFRRHPQASFFAIVSALAAAGLAHA